MHHASKVENLTPECMHFVTFQKSFCMISLLHCSRNDCSALEKGYSLLLALSCMYTGTLREKLRAPQGSSVHQGSKILQYHSIQSVRSCICINVSTDGVKLMGCEDAFSFLCWHGTISSSTPKAEGLTYLFFKSNYIHQE